MIAHPTRLGEFAAALEDSAAAVRLDVSNAMGHFRLGLANFYVGSFSDALASFKRASSLDASTMWIRKCEAELSGSALPLKATVHATLAAPSPDAWVVGCRTNSLLFAKSKTSLVIFSLGSLLFPWIFSGYDSAEFIYDSSSMNAVEVS